MLLFHKMGTLIDLIGLTEIFFPRADGHYTATAIMVTGTKKGKELVPAGMEGSIFQGLTSMLTIFS